MPTDLYFDLAATLRLAEHAIAAPEHTQSYSEADDGRPCPGALEWVADWGTYLMSGGRPPLLSDPDDPTSNIVVYAHGWDDSSDRAALAATDVGGDDFVEHLHLTQPDDPDDPSGPPLITLLREGAAAGYRWLVLRVTPERVASQLSRTGPDGR